MRLQFILLTSIITAFLLFGCTEQNKNDQIQSETNDKIIVLETIDSSKYFPEIIPLRYDQVSSFKEGFADVRIGDKWGFIDKSGNDITSLKYDEASSFNEGFAKVKLGDKWCFIDKSGMEITPLKYDAVTDFHEGFAQVKLGDKWGFIDRSGMEIVSPKYSLLSDFDKGFNLTRAYRWAGKGIYQDNVTFVNKLGKEVARYNFSGVHQFNEGLALFTIISRIGISNTTYKYGFINESFMVVSENTEYTNMWGFQEGLAKVGIHGKWGFIDKTFKEVIPVQFDYACNFYEGLAKVGIGDKYGLINKSGNEITNLKYSEISESESDNGFRYVKFNDKWGFIDNLGKEITPLKYINVSDFHDGFARVNFGENKWGFIDKLGKEIIPLKYGEVEDFHEGFAMVRIDDYKWGFIDHSGKEITPLKYKRARGFHKGFAMVCIEENKWGFIDNSGKEITPLKYDYVYDFEEGIAAVAFGKKVGFIGKQKIESTTQSSSKTNLVQTNSELNDKILNLRNALDKYQNSYKTVEEAYNNAYNNHLNGTERYKGEYANARYSAEKLCERAVSELQIIAITNKEILNKSPEVNSKLGKLYNQFKELNAQIFAD